MFRRHRRNPGRLAGRLVVLASLSLLALGSRASGQQGAVTGIIPQVLNPATPAEGRTDVTLRELWRLGGKGADPEGIGLVSAAFLDQDGNVCLLDSDHGELRVFDAAGKRVRTIRPGADLAEFFHSTSGAWARDPAGYGLLQTYPPRLLRYGADGAPAGNLVPSLSGLPPADSARTTISVIGARALGENLVLDCLVEMSIPRHGQIHRRHLLGVFDRSGSLQRPLIQTDDDTELGDSVSIREREAIRFQGRWTTGPEGTILAAPDLYGYRIHVYDETGGMRRILSREYTSVPRTPQEYARVKELFVAFARSIPRATVSIERTHADIQDLQVAADRTVWVLSSEGRFRAPAGVLGVYDVFDAGGRFVRQVALHGEGDATEDGIWLVGDRVIVARQVRAAVLARLGGAAADQARGGAVICYAR